MSQKDETSELLEGRKATYGDRVKNMEAVAAMWSALKGVHFEPWEIPLLMSAVKMHRIFQSPDYGDSVDDVDGWMQMFREVMGDDLIQVRTVEEYIAEKTNREKQEAGLSIENETPF